MEGGILMEGSFPGAPVSRFFNREFEKTPSPDKEAINVEIDLVDQDLLRTDPLEFDHLSVTPEPKAALPTAAFIVAKVGAGVKAKADSPSSGGEVVVQAKEAAGKKKTARCDPIFVQQLIQKHKLYPRTSRPFKGVPDELLSKGGEAEQKLRELQVRCAARLNKKWDWEEDIINQYYTKGYAEYLIEEEEEEGN